MHACRTPGAARLPAVIGCGTAAAAAGDDVGGWRAGEDGWKSEQTIGSLEHDVGLVACSRVTSSSCYLAAPLISEKQSDTVT